MRGYKSIKEVCGLIYGAYSRAGLVWDHLAIPGGGGCVKSVLYRTLSVRDLYFIFAYIGLNPYYIRAYIARTSRVHRTKSVLYPYYIGLNPYYIRTSD